MQMYWCFALAHYVPWSRISNIRPGQELWVPTKRLSFCRCRNAFHSTAMLHLTHFSWTWDLSWNLHVIFSSIGMALTQKHIMQSINTPASRERKLDFSILTNVDSSYGIARTWRQPNYPRKWLLIYALYIRQKACKWDGGILLIFVSEKIGYYFWRRVHVYVWGHGTATVLLLVFLSMANMTGWRDCRGSICVCKGIRV